jgi:hypothetical protein
MVELTAHFADCHHKRSSGHERESTCKAPDESRRASGTNFWFLVSVVTNEIAIGRTVQVVDLALLLITDLPRRQVWQ